MKTEPLEGETGGGMGKGLVVVIAGIAALGCGGSGPTLVSGTVEELPQWEFALESGFRIGAHESTSGFPFGRIRSVLQTSDGHVFVADDLAFEVHEFDPNGEHLRSFGGEGDGPGEFDVLASVWATPSGVATWDPRHARVTWWSADGGADSITTLTSHRGQLLLGWDEESSEMVFRRVSGMPSMEERRGSYLAEFIPKVSDGEPTTPIAAISFQEAVRLRGWPGGMAQRVPFGALGLGAVSGGLVYVADGGTPRVTGYSMSGSERFVLDLDLPRHPVTEDDREEWREAQVQTFGGDAAAARPFILVVEEEVGYSELHPVLLSAIGAVDGDAWFRIFDRDARSWIVVGPNGEARARVDLPVGFRPIRVSERSILAISVDQFDQESIVRLNRVD